MRKNFIWEFVALIITLIVLGTFAAPLFDDQFMGKGEKDIVIRLNVQEAGGFVPNEIKLKKGETVRLVIVGQDVVHGFLIEGLLNDTGPIDPGKTKIVELTPQAEGEYIIRCTIYCSPDHPNMMGKVIVEA